MDFNKIIKTTYDAIDDKKGERINILNISDISVIADYFIIANGTNTSQIQALADEVEEKLGREVYPLRQMEGYDHANWVLLDFGDIIIHIFDKENRLFYDLERIWRDGKMIEPESLKSESMGLLDAFPFFSGPRESCAQTTTGIFKSLASILRLRVISVTS